MKPGQPRRSAAFTLLREETADSCKPPTTASIPAISPAGITIDFPAQPCEGYLDLLNREIVLKDEFLPTKGPVSSLWLRGYPLRQLASDAITELVFRLCSHFNLKNNQGADRGIHLGPEYCDRNTLALLKGLGFEVIRLILDATIAGPDRSVDGLRRAIESVEEFCGLRLQSDIYISAHTDPAYLHRLLRLLVASPAEEIELAPCLPDLHAIEDELRCQKTLAQAAQQLVHSGYQRLAEHCFKKPSHPDLALRDNHRLSYGPWGFYRSDIVTWLGLGAGAEGILRGYLYHNIADPNCYRQSVLNHINPVAGWSCKPLADQAPYQLIQALFCHHSLACSHFHDISRKSLASLIARGWLRQHGKQLQLTTEGVEHLASVCRSIIGNSNGDQH